MGTSRLQSTASAAINEVLPVSLPVFKVRAGGCVAVGTGAKEMGIAPLQTAKNKPSRTRALGGGLGKP
jgi:hypothetical protein